ncbi:Esterase-like activity of phytase-domain-containing protein [Madurella fahalii]|uniref:Esterase-like activity of phytase-domain-containing protein n=1 Tax=Madurella fahalii TaxID=1157608 RepID=A0ABQ0G4A4_9PEZI
MVSPKKIVGLGFTLVPVVASIKRGTSAVTSVSCNGQSYIYDGLAGYGSLQSDARDQYGDTISIGSSMAIKDWKRTGKGYKGTMYGLPDRGWNTNGTQNSIPRIHIFDISFEPVSGVSVAQPSGPNLEFQYKRTILLSGPDGRPLTGLDPDFTGGQSYPGFPTMPAATYLGDGFGGTGPGDKRISLDAEGLVVDGDWFWISDEYGPFIYRFDKDGKMVAAIQPPDALLPIRKGEVSYNSNTPRIYNQSYVPDPEDPEHGRQNNQGFEGLTMSADGKSLWVMLQSAAQQDGGSSSSTRRNTRLLRYLKKQKSDMEDDVQVTYEAEYVVPLPIFENAEGEKRVAAQSEILSISDTQLLVLARDSNAGRGQEDPLSRYRHVDIVDVSGATNIKGPKFDDIQNGNITDGIDSDALVAGINPAELCPFIDYNINSELNKFKTAEGDVIHNGAPINLGLLNEKWEALALVPVHMSDKGKGCGKSSDDYYLITLSDNDFITDNGFYNFGQVSYTDDSATVPLLHSQALVFKVTLPKNSKPLAG